MSDRNDSDARYDPESEKPVRYHKRDYWRTENLKYSRAHYRLEKAAGIVNEIAAGREADLLDIGCGPAALMDLIQPNISYYGIDIAIHQPAPNLLEADILETPIAFAGRKFDIAVAQGVFEYVGDFQTQKLAEIRALLRDGGRFLASYVNFSHRSRQIYSNYNNVQGIDQFRLALAEFFVIRDAFPTSHNWHHSEPQRRLLRRLQLNLNVNIPYISPRLAVEYFFVCSPRMKTQALRGSGRPQAAVRLRLNPPVAQIGGPQKPMASRSSRTVPRPGCSSAFRTSRRLMALGEP